MAVPAVNAAGDCAGISYFIHMRWVNFWIILGSIRFTSFRGYLGAIGTECVIHLTRVGAVGIREKEGNAKGIEYLLVRASMGSLFFYTYTLDPVATERSALAKRSNFQRLQIILPQDAKPFSRRQSNRA
jgi:hypothetical protein